MTNQDDAAFEFVKELGRELASKDFDLPPFPDTAMRVKEAVSDPDISISKLSGIVMSEPSLVARLLLMANSVAMRRGPIQVTDTRTAISRVGLDMVRNLAVAYAAREAFKAEPGSSLLARLEATRSHSIEVSAIAYVLARRLRRSVRPDEAMLAGLLHAVGKFYIYTRVESFPSLFSDEQALEDLVHQWGSGVGRAIVESWGFSEEVACAVDEYSVLDRDPSAPSDLTDFVLISNLIAKSEYEVEPESLEGLKDLSTLARMRIDLDTLQKVLQDSQGDIESLIQTMRG